MEISNQDYSKMVDDKAKPSPSWKNLLWAFCVGGGICTIGQGLTALYKGMGLDRDQTGTAVSVTLIAAAALLTGLGWFDLLAKQAGAGTLVPITGFANAVASPAIDFRAEGVVTGTAVKMFTVAGPVIVFGTAASAVYGLLLWAMQ